MIWKIERKIQLRCLISLFKEVIADRFVMKLTLNKCLTKNSFSNLRCNKMTPSRTPFFIFHCLFTFYLSFLPCWRNFESNLVSEKQEIMDLLLPTAIVKTLLF